MLIFSLFSNFIAINLNYGTIRRAVQYHYFVCNSKKFTLTELIALIKFTSKQSNHCKAFSNIHSPFYTYSQNQGIGNRADANGNIIKNCWNVQNLDNGIIFALESRRRQ
mmetsp:Transcript_59164/g.69170  ORF Transcript_59164/g.69170 Transcript_59164/m.69170 type:complete len:109 (-) Transcript_59164:465-791(-)